jgi:putative toxin-antitoxin system antitoxin component, TIGR02293 family
MSSTKAVKEKSSTRRESANRREAAEGASQHMARKPGHASPVEGVSEDPWLGRLARWDDTEADARIREGLPFEIVAHIQSLLDLTDEEAASLIGRSRSTYSRYRNKDQDLGTAEAERAVRFARLIALAAETFGALEEAKEWMLEENYALGGERPFELAETDPGARVVRNLLLGIQHGHPV